MQEGGYPPVSDSARRILAALVVVVVVGGIVLANRSENSDTRSVVRHEIQAVSPCLTYGPHSAICHKSFSRAIKTITPQQVCELLALEPRLTHVVSADCKAIAERTRRQHAAATSVPPADHASAPIATDAPTSGTHHSQTSTPAGGEPAHPGGHPSPAPTNPGTTQPPPPPSESPSSAPAPETSAPTSPVAEPEAPATEPPEAGPVRSTVESALGLVCSLAKRLAGLC